MARTTGEGERKLVTVLVVDIVGSTALAERMDPEEWTNIVFGAHQRMSDAVLQFRGTVAQFTGDGLLAFFGAPLSREDDALRATQAGIAIQSAIAEYAQLIKTKQIDHFDVRVGLHTGMVIVGAVGNAQYTEYLAVGETVPLAQQVQSAAPPGAVVVSDETAQLIQGAFELERIGELRGAGRTRAIAVWRVGEATVQGEILRGSDGLNAPLIGREREMARMSDRVNALAEGRGALISIICEAGVGKSRLIEFARLYARERLAPLGGGHWFEARGIAYGGSIYSLFQQILRVSLGIKASDSVDAIRHRLRVGAERPHLANPERVVHMLELMLPIDEHSNAAEPPFSDLQGEALQR